MPLVDNAYLHTLGTNELWVDNGSAVTQMRPCIGTFTDVATSWASTPDMAIAGDLDIRLYDVLTSDWSRPAFQILCSKNKVGEYSFIFALNTTGQLVIYISTNGTALVSVVQASGFTDGVMEAGIRVTRQVVGGTVRFWHLVDGVWTQIGTNQGLSSGDAIFDTDDPIRVGGRVDADQPFIGTIRRMEYRTSLLGDPVAVADFSGVDPSSTSWTDPQGKVWTMNTGATVGVV